MPASKETNDAIANHNKAQYDLAAAVGDIQGPNDCSLFPSRSHIATFRALIGPPP